MATSSADGRVELAGDRSARIESVDPMTPHNAAYFATTRQNSGKGFARSRPRMGHPLPTMAVQSINLSDHSPGGASGAHPSPYFAGEKARLMPNQVDRSAWWRSQAAG